MEYILASWKMYPTVDEAHALFEDIQGGLQERARAGRLPTVIICPTFLSLVPLRAVADDRVVHLGAQNCHWEQEGPYTGEISPKMLQGLVEYVLVGHSERRAAGETDEQIAKKVAAAQQAGLVPILLVGEDDRADDAILLTERRLRDGLSLADPENVLVVYEPSWAIGATEPAPPDHIRRGVEHLKNVLVDMGAQDPRIIYGGTVNDDNIDEVVSVEVLDGVGSGRGSLNAEGFLRIVDRVAAERR